MRSTLFIILALLQFSPSFMYGQEKEMFIEQIAGKKIVRENFNDNGEQQGKQVFSIGELKQQSNIYEVDVIVEVYDSKNKLEKKYTTTYKCNPNEFDVLVNVFPFADPSDAKIKVEVTSKDFQKMYDLNGSEKLRDIHLKMSVESGILNFFGSKNLVIIKERKKELINTSVRIRSKAVIEAYLMGIRIKTISYTVEEYLTENFVLQRQKFTQDDEAYFSMTYDSTN